MKWIKYFLTFNTRVQMTQVNNLRLHSAEPLEGLQSLCVGQWWTGSTLGESSNILPDFFSADTVGKTQVHSLSCNYPAVSPLVYYSLHAFSTQCSDRVGRVHTANGWAQHTALTISSHTIIINTSVKVKSKSSQFKANCEWPVFFPFPLLEEKLSFPCHLHFI